MLAHSTNAGVQKNGCAVLAGIATMVGTLTGGIEAIVAAMRGHEAVVDVQTSGCRALSALTYENVDDATMAIDAVIAAMRAHSTVADVQEGGCTALAKYSIHW